MDGQNDRKSICVRQNRQDCSGLDFWIVSGYEDRLFADQGLDWSDPSGDERAELVKANPRRRVWRVGLGDLEVYVKRYELDGVIGAIKNLLRASPVAAEFANYVRARAAGVNCPEPLAYAQKGLRGIRGSSVLITKAIAGGQPLDRYLSEHEFNKGLIEQLARLIGRGHRAGLVHPDPHLGNFIVSAKPNGRADLFFTDLQKLHRIRRARTSGTIRGSMRKNLAWLYGSIGRHLDEEQRKMFLGKYLEALESECAFSEDQQEGLRVELEGLAWKRRQHKLAKRDRRCKFTNKYFAIIRVGRWKGSAFLWRKGALRYSAASRTQFTAKQWSEALAQRKGLFPGEELVVRRQLRVGAVELDILAKRLTERVGLMPRLPGLWQRFGWRQLQREYEVGFALLRRQIGVALPLAWLGRRVGVFGVSQMLISEVPVNCRPLGEFVKAGGELKDLAKMAGAFVGNIVRHGFIGDSFGLSKILVQESEDGGQRLLLSSAEDIRRVGRLTRARRLAIAAQMQQNTATQGGISRTLRLKFLLEYLKASGEQRSKWKWYWRQISSPLLQE